MPFHISLIIMPLIFRRYRLRVAHHIAPSIHLASQLYQHKSIPSKGRYKPDSATIRILDQLPTNLFTSSSNWVPSSCREPVIYFNSSRSFKLEKSELLPLPIKVDFPAQIKARDMRH